MKHEYRYDKDEIQGSKSAGNNNNNIYSNNNNNIQNVDDFLDGIYYNIITITTTYNNTRQY